MKKCFVISWFYPPINSSESMVTYKLLKYSNNHYDVWTRNDVKSGVWDRDLKEKSLTSDNITPIYGNSDNLRIWIDEAIRYFEDHIDEYDSVMTRSMPPESHYFGKYIKNKYPNIKWIASFGDPLINTPYVDLPDEDNPYKLKRIIEKESPSKLRTLRIAISPTRIAQRFVWYKEKKATGVDVVEYKKIHDFTLKNADLIITNNSYQLDHIFAGQYEKYKNKGVVIPHSFDLALYPKVNNVHNKKITFTYTGHLDDIRNARPLLRALNKMQQKDELLSNKISIKFYGHVSPKDKLYIINHKLYSLIELNDDISYRDSLRVIQESDWLILFDANFTKQTDRNIYFPAKLADYIGANRNIIAITQTVGASADIIRRVGGGIVCTHSADEIYMYLSKIVYKSWEPHKRNSAEAESFNSKNVSKLLDEEINKLLGD